MTEPLIHQHIRAAVAYEARCQDRLEATIRGHEEEGCRVVEGGQTGDTTWEVTDHRTGVTIAKGDGGFEEYRRVADEIGQLWVEYSQIMEEVYEDGPPVTEGLPEALCNALSDWVEVASPEEVEVALR